MLALVFARTRRGGLLLLGASAAAVTATVYSWWLGPFLIHELNGYWPSFFYQHLPVRKLVNPRFYREAGDLLLNYASTLLGGVPSRGIALLASAAGLWVGRAWLGRGRPDRGGSLGPLLVLAVAVSQIALFAIMIVRHRPIYVMSDHRLWYYPLVFQAILLFGLLVLLERLAEAGAATRRVSVIVMALLVLSNVARWPELRQVMAEGPWFRWTTNQSALLRVSLREGHVHPWLLRLLPRVLLGVPRRFPALPTAPGPEVREGAGFWRTDLREGPPGVGCGAAPSNRGPRLAAMVLLRPSETLKSVDQAGVHLLSVSRRGDRPGLEPLALTLRLHRGSSEIELRSSLPEVSMATSAGAATSSASEGMAGFGLAFPVLLFREGPSRPAPTRQQGYVDARPDGS